MKVCCGGSVDTGEVAVVVVVVVVVGGGSVDVIGEVAIIGWGVDVSSKVSGGGVRLVALFLLLEPSLDIVVMLSIF